MGMIARRLPKFRWFQSRPKTASCCRWVLGSVAMLTLAAWVWSMLALVQWWVPSAFGVRLHGGGVYLLLDLPAGDVGEAVRQSLLLKRGFHVQAIPLAAMESLGPELFRFNFSLPYIERATLGHPLGKVLVVWCPLWTVLLVTWPPAIAAWRNRWVVKREVGTCHTCGYARTSLAETGICPECGTAPVIAKF